MTVNCFQDIEYSKNISDIIAYVMIADEGGNRRNMR